MTESAGITSGPGVSAPAENGREPAVRIVDLVKEFPGVKAVVTGHDAPGHLMGKVLRDMPVLCWDRVRYIGDRVAAVAAETPEAAEEALLRIDVDYEVLPAVFDPMEAMRPDAPLLHDDVASYAGASSNPATATIAACQLIRCILMHRV
jgi:CO/xanthine dehydrogenase Mo-binding subunit